MDSFMYIKYISVRKNIDHKPSHDYIYALKFIASILIHFYIMYISERLVPHNYILHAINT